MHKYFVGNMMPSKGLSQNTEWTTFFGISIKHLLLEIKMSLQYSVQIDIINAGKNIIGTPKRQNIYSTFFRYRSF